MHRSRIRIIAAVLIGMTLQAFIAVPAARASEAPGVRELRYDLKMDGVITALVAAGYLGTYLLEDHLAPESCRWCGIDAFDDWGHRNLAWSNAGAADVASSITGFALTPLIAFGVDAWAAHDSGALGGFPVDALIIAEAASVSAMLTQIVKFSAGRQRPDAHYAANGSTSPKDNTSFYSGHTSIAFALAVSSGTVATMRGYRLAPLIWGAGLAAAATTGYLRVAADRHYLTDVIAGAALGSAVGFGLPYLFHRPRDDGGRRFMISAVPYGGGGLLSVAATL